jgi:phage terminase large subunit-like protein
VTTKQLTKPSTPRLSELARHFSFPDGITKTVWPRVEAQGKKIGLGFDWWQSQLGTVCLGYGEDGQYVATVGGVGMSIPRQVGKTYFVLAMLVCLCILFPGLQVIWTAHHLRTSTKTFTTLRGICRRTQVAPHVKAMRSANGEQQVEFHNGSMIMFGARSMGFGRGFDEIDVEVFDEAQILDTKALEDMIAATNQARHEYGALLFFMGTPPRSTDPSGAFTARRTEALAGDKEDAIWLEIGADPGSHVDDRSQWPTMNPSYPLRTPLNSMLRLRKNLKDDDSWNREGRGVWDDLSETDVINLKTWAALADESSLALDPVVFALDVSFDRSRSSIGMAGRRADGSKHVEVVQTGAGTSWLVPRISELVEKWKPSTVVIDKGSAAAASLIPAMHERGLEPKMTEMLTNSVGAAFGAFYDEVAAGTLHHLDQESLNVALAGAKTRPIGTALTWDRKTQETDITPLTAVTFASWGFDHMQSKILDVSASVW